MKENREELILEVDFVRHLLKSVFTEYIEVQETSIDLDKLESEFVVIKNDFIDFDPDDGISYVFVIQRLSDEKYFSLNYTDLDIYDYDYDDFPNKLTEVFPELLTTTIFV